MPLSHRAVLLLGALALAACPVWGEKEYEAPLLEGNYRVAYGAGYAPGDEDRLLEVRALLATPLAFAKCGPTRMVLADSTGAPAAFLAFDRE